MTTDRRTTSERAPWALGRVVTPRPVLECIEACAVAAYARGEEACGFLVGPASDPLLVDEAVELENLANKYHAVDPEGHPRTGREYFKVNSLKFERTIAVQRDLGRPVKVFFHSHLDCGAYFSAEDAASMTGGGTSAPAHDLAYWVTAVDDGVVTAHALFVYSDETGEFDKASFEVSET